MTITVGTGSMNGNYVFAAPEIRQPGIVYGSLKISAQVGPSQAIDHSSYNEPISSTVQCLSDKTIKLLRIKLL